MIDVSNPWNGGRKLLPKNFKGISFGKSFSMIFGWCCISKIFATEKVLSSANQTFEFTPTEIFKEISKCKFDTQN